MVCTQRPSAALDQVARLVLHLCCSSAAAERVFSLFSATFGPQQRHALEDVIESAMFLQYNDRNPTGFGVVSRKMTL